LTVPFAIEQAAGRELVYVGERVEAAGFAPIHFANDMRKEEIIEKRGRTNEMTR
jgi:hypothetical protein